MYLGNVNGPTLESVLARIAPAFLQSGGEREDLEMDIAFTEQETQRNEVRPLKLDKDGKPYVEFVIQGQLVRHFLDDQPTLSGDIAVERDSSIGVAKQVELHRWQYKLTPIV